MTPQRRTALVSIGAAALLAALKLGAGLVSGSLGSISEALHSGTDLVAALLTFFAIGVSGRPADEGHQYGHGKAEHLAALAEATVLALVSLAVAALAVTRLTGTTNHGVDTAWWLFFVVAIVIVIDLSRTVVSLSTARRYGSEALRSNAIHFGSDFAGTLAVLAGLLRRGGRLSGGRLDRGAVRGGARPSRAGRLIRRNVDVLMDRAPADAEAAARAAIAGIDPPICTLPAPPPPGGRPNVRRRRDLRSRPAPRSARVTRLPTGSRRSSKARCPAAMSSSTSSPEPTRRRSESARSLPR